MFGFPPEAIAVFVGALCGASAVIPLGIALLISVLRLNSYGAAIRYLLSRQDNQSRTIVVREIKR